MSQRWMDFERALLIAAVVMLAGVSSCYVVDLADPPKAPGAWIELSFTLPDTYADVTYCGIPDSAVVDSLTGELLQGSPLHSLRSVRLYGYLFKQGAWGPEPTLRDTLDVRGMEGQRVRIGFQADPGMMGFVWVTTTNEGMESCALGGYTFAIPAVDSVVQANYELTWKKP